MPGFDALEVNNHASKQRGKHMHTHNATRSKVSGDDIIVAAEVGAVLFYRDARGHPH